MRVLLWLSSSIELGSTSVGHIIGTFPLTTVELIIGIGDNYLQLTNIKMEAALSGPIPAAISVPPSCASSK